MAKLKIGRKKNNMDIIKETAMGVAMRFHLIDIPEDMTYTEAYDQLAELITDETMWVWEPFEDWEISSLTDSIWNLYNEVNNALMEVNK